MRYLKQQLANTIIVLVTIMLAPSGLALGASKNSSAVEEAQRTDTEVRSSQEISPNPQCPLSSKAEDETEAAIRKPTSIEATVNQPDVNKLPPERPISVDNFRKIASDAVKPEKKVPGTSKSADTMGKQRIPRPTLQIAPNRTALPQPAPNTQGTSSVSRPFPDQHQPQPAPGPSSIAPGINPNSQRSTNPEAQTGTLLKDNYPAVGQMEVSIFGYASPDLGVEDRLFRIEQTVYKRNYPQESLFDRTERLKRTLFGDPSHMTETRGDETSVSPRAPELSDSGYEGYFEEIARRPGNQKPIPKEDVEKFALELINYERANLGQAPLLTDELAHKVAQEHINDLSKRNVISHAGAKGLNPDERYTSAGGTNVLTESLVSIKTEDAQSEKFTRALAARILKVLMSRQDDRDAILNSEATSFGMAIDCTANKDKIVACVEIITERGTMHQIPREVHIGDQIEMRGVVLKPYKFERVTVAWEGLNPDLSSTPDESDEALPYFPPLDYVAYATRSQHDYDKAIGALRTVGVIAAIAGGMFMPPVAFAVPIIAMSGGVGEPKPASDIPVRGRIKVEGSTFYGKIPISNNGKEGLYYVTVWASLGDGMKLTPISRRTVVAKLDDSQAKLKTQSQSSEIVNKDKSKKHRSKKKHRRLKMQTNNTDIQ